MGRWFSCFFDGIATFHRTSVMYRAAEQEETQDALRQALFLSINGNCGSDAAYEAGTGDFCSLSPGSNSNPIMIQGA